MRAEYLLISSMDIDPSHESLFNEIYNEEHIPELLRVPGVHGITRYERRPLEMSIGGKIQLMPDTMPRYHAVYEIDDPGVLVSEQWARRVEIGRWSTDVRPFTTNRRFLLAKRV